MCMHGVEAMLCRPQNQGMQAFQQNDNHANEPARLLLPQRQQQQSTRRENVRLFVCALYPWFKNCLNISSSAYLLQARNTLWVAATPRGCCCLSHVQPPRANARAYAACCNASCPGRSCLVPIHPLRYGSLLVYVSVPPVWVHLCN